MIKRLSIAIVILSAIATIPYYLGVLDLISIELHKGKCNIIELWMIGLVNLLILTIIGLILYIIIMCFKYTIHWIKYGE